MDTNANIDTGILRDQLREVLRRHGLVENLIVKGRKQVIITAQLRPYNLASKDEMELYRAALDADTAGEEAEAG